MKSKSISRLFGLGTNLRKERKGRVEIETGGTYSDDLEEVRLILNSLFYLRRFTNIYIYTMSLRLTVILRHAI